MQALLAACVVAAAPLCAIAKPDEAHEQWHVLLIRNWDSPYPISVIREKALRDTILHDAPRVVDMYAEELDPLRFFSTDIEQEFLTLLRKKYRDRHIDLIIASGAEPLAFATLHRDDIWPGAAIVFYGVLDGTLDPAQLGSRTTGVTMTFDVRGSLALGAALVPAARSVYFIAGTAPFDRLYLGHALRELARFDPSLQAKLIVGLPRAQMLERVAQVEPDSLLFYLTMHRDGNNQIYPPASETLMEVVRRSRAPVLSAVPTQLGLGPVGGSAASMEPHGKAAGVMVRSILEGASPESIPIRADPGPECEVNWSALQHWNLREEDVPRGCRIVNHPLSPLRMYFWPLLGLASIILVEAALISSLMLQRRHRRAAEAALHARNAEMARMAHLSMMGALTATIAHEINQPMGSILTNAEVAEIMLDQGNVDVPKLREILADIRSEDLRASEVIRSLRRLFGRREPDAVEFDVNSEVAEALSHLALDAARRDVALVPVFDGSVPRILGNRMQLQQCLINLVMNAMDAVSGEPGTSREVRIETRAHARGAEIVVSDGGPGIAPEHAKSLFDSIFTTKKEGMGLGLSIVRNIVEMHGGRVSYEPNVPRGAMFRVWLPAIDM